MKKSKKEKSASRLGLRSPIGRRPHRAKLYLNEMFACVAIGAASFTPLAPPFSRPATNTELLAVRRLLRIDMAEAETTSTTIATTSKAPKLKPRRGRRSRSRSRSPRPLAHKLLYGNHPNIYWRAVAPESLRTHPRVVALPPASAMELAGPATFWWVRQTDDLWDELHEGVLTSRHLLASLGMRDPRAAASCGLPRGVVQAGALARCWSALRDSSRRVPKGRLTWQPPEKVDAATAANVAWRDAYNAELKSAGAVGSGDGNGDGSAAAWDGRRGPDGDDPISSDKWLRQCAEAIGKDGDISRVRCAWGSAQEASALAAFLESLPAEARLEEIGMAVASPGQMPSEDLRMAALSGQLPCLGASPDWMLRREPGADLEVVEVRVMTPLSRRYASLDALYYTRTHTRVLLTTVYYYEYALTSCESHTASSPLSLR